MTDFLILSLKSSPETCSEIHALHGGFAADFPPATLQVMKSAATDPQYAMSVHAYISKQLVDEICTS